MTAATRVTRWHKIRARYRAIGGEVWRTHPDDGRRMYAANWNACDWIVATLAQLENLIPQLEAGHQWNLQQEAEFWARERGARRSGSPDPWEPVRQ